MKGSIAIGSRRTTPTSPVAAAVVSDESVAPMNVPWTQSRDSVTSGTVVRRRPPKKIAEIGTPAGASHSGAGIGHCRIGLQYREFGWELGSSLAGVQSSPFQDMAWAGSFSMPSHQMSWSSVSATLVKTELPFSMVRMALGLVFSLVPGATPKKPNSGLTPYSRPASPNRIPAMQAPRISTFQPGTVGSSMARFVLPHELGNAAAM